MKADTTRSTFKKTNHYNSVRMQQGRVQLDADWNEQIDITGHRIETETIDVIGHCGAPMHNAGFHIVANANNLSAEEQKLPENQNAPVPAAGDLLISAGRYYVDGILCENEKILTFTNQPDLPKTQPVVNAGTYLAYIDVSSRHITALEDPAIREVALGGPDTATRAKTIWQVKLFHLGDINLAGNCSTVFDAWDQEIAAGTGRMAARVAVSSPSNDPCIVAPGAGYRRLENQHYRVEVHESGTLGKATFKWSRENGSIVTKWESHNGNDLTVSSIGRDQVLNFAGGQWVELTDDTRELMAQPGILVQLDKAEGNVLTIKPGTETEPIDFTKFSGNPKIRRWDMVTLLKPGNQNWIDLEDGVQVHFTPGNYKAHDYWLIPARTATANIEWPIDPATGDASKELPYGILHHYCRLSVLKFDGATWTSVTDCRNIFPPLTELIDFFYLGGDGQEAMPDLTQPNILTQLAAPLEAGVTNGEWPVEHANVRFTVIKGNGALQGNVSQVIAPTGANGVASCVWSIDSTTHWQQVEAVLLDDSGNPIHVPIHYNASPSVASQVAYDPGNACASLQNQKTVQQAIETLASLASLYIVSGGNQSISPAGTLEPLVVIASSKCGPMPGMNVVFTVISGGGQVMQHGGAPIGSGAAVSVITDAAGMATCDWTPGNSPGMQIVEAVLQTGPGAIVAPVLVRFTAQSQTAGAEPGIHVREMKVGATNEDLKNNMDLFFEDLIKGLIVRFDELVDPGSFLSKHEIDNPVCFVTVDIPYPFTPSDRQFYPHTEPACFQKIILGAKVSVNKNLIRWLPPNATLNWLAALFSQLKEAKLPERVLTRLTIKGNFVWSPENSDLFLDGELFALKTLDEVRLPSGDQKRGGNLEMWFWLIKKN